MAGVERKRGRPARTGSATESTRLVIRLDPEERARVEAASARVGMPAASWVRAAALRAAE